MIFTTCLTLFVTFYSELTMKKGKKTNSALLPSLGLATDAKSLLKAMVASKFTLSLRDLKNN